MQRIEPTTCLVNAFCNEVSGEDDSLVELLFVLKRIMYLGIRHSTRVEPNVDEVELTLQHGATLADEPNLVDIRAMKVDAVVVLLTHVARHEAFFLERIAGHHAGSYCLLYLVVQLFYGADANLFASILVAPNRKRCTPIT